MTRYQPSRTARRVSLAGAVVLIAVGAAIAYGAPATPAPPSFAGVHANTATLDSGPGNQSAGSGNASGSVSGNLDAEPGEQLPVLVVEVGS